MNVNELTLNELIRMFYAQNNNLTPNMEIVVYKTTNSRPKVLLH